MPQEGPQTEFLSRREDIVLFGGAKGPGKTDGLIAESLRQTDQPGYKGVLIRRTFPRLQEIIDRAHKMFPKFGAKWVASLHRYVFPSGAIVQFGHCQNEQDKFNYQGSEYAFLGFDQLEEFTESQFDFICMQNRTTDPDLKCYIRATANPGGPGHMFVKRRFIDGKTPGKTYKTEREMPDGRKLFHTFCFIKSTVYDNKILIQNDPMYVSRLMNLPEIERKAYLDGDWNAFTSQCVFDPTGMANLETKIREPLWIGGLQETAAGYQIVQNEQGNLKIWRTPEPGLEYQIAVDAAMGDDQGDNTSINVLSKLNWEQVAHWHGKCGPIEAAKIAYQMGRFYNLAEIAVEIPGPGQSTVDHLNQLDYPHLYYYEKDKLGFLENEKGRANMLALFADAVRDGSVIIRDRVTLDEMYNFIRGNRGRIQAREGCHDDCIFSLGIAVYTTKINPFHEPSAHSRRPDRLMTSILRDSGSRRDHHRRVANL